MRGRVLNNAMDCRRLMRGKVQDMSSTAVTNEGAGLRYVFPRHRLARGRVLDMYTTAIAE